MPDSDRYLVFLRSYNDVDHVTPVVWRLCSEGAPVDVVIVGHRSLHDDYRIAFLRSRACNVTHVLDAVRDPEAVCMRASEFDAADRAVFGAGLDDRDIADLLDRSFGGGGGCVVVDWIGDPMPERRLVERLAPAAKKRELGFVALPHGDAPYSSVLFKPKDLDVRAPQRHEITRLFDAVAVPNRWCQRRFTPLLGEDRVAILGSARYCSEWVERLEKLTPAFVDPWPGTSDVRLAFLLRPPAWHTSWEEIERLVRVALSTGCVRIVIKHHTRAGPDVRTGRSLLHESNDRIHIACDEDHTGAICKWADLVAHTGTSAVNDAILYGKGVVSLESVSHAQTLTAAELPGTIVLDRDGLADRIDGLSRDRRRIGYSAAERDRYIARTIAPCGGDVLGNYVRFLRRHAGTSVESVAPRRPGATVVIPARMGSSRFPGKPLAPIGGIPMVGHCVYRARMCESVGEVLVATCDEPIAAYARGIGCKVIMTSSDHERASDRVAEAVDQLEARGRVLDVVVMLQGDEPMVTPGMIDAALAPFARDPSVEVVNLMAPIESREMLDDPNVIKVLTDRAGDALYMTRAAAPTRQPDGGPLGWRQVCIIPFRREALRRFTGLEPTPLEGAEGIDMLRLIEHGYRVRMVPIDCDAESVDTPEELVSVERAMMNSDSLFPRYAGL